MGNFALLLQGVGENMYHEVVAGQPLLRWAMEPSPKKSSSLGAERACWG